MNLEDKLAGITKSNEFCSAVKAGNLPLVQTLSLEPQVNLNWNVGSGGATPFFLACAFGFKDMVRFFLGFKRPVKNKWDEERPIDYNLQSTLGTTPFAIACQNGWEEIVEMLLGDERIDFGPADHEGKTPLWKAARHGSAGVVQTLLASGKPVQAAKRHPNSGTTPREIAMATNRGTLDSSYDSIGRDPGPLETKGDSHKRELSCPAIAALLMLYEQDPVAVRNQLRLELGYNTIWLKNYLGCMAMPFPARILPSGCEDPKLAKGLCLKGDNSAILSPKIAEFTGLTKFDISFNRQLDDSSAEAICDLLRNANSLTTFYMTDTNIGPKGMLKILQAMVWNFSQGNFSLKNLELDDIKLESFEGLAIIPIDILEQGCQRVARYLLDLFSAPSPDPLYRSKLMVVGFAEIGKTSVLECVFPMTGVLLSRETKKRRIKRPKVLWTEGSVELIGNNFTHREIIRGDRVPEVTKKGKKEQKEQKERPFFGTIYLSHRKEDGWLIVKIDDLEKPGFRIQRSTPEPFFSELYCDDVNERDRWFDRIDGFLKRDRTHGIDIREIDASSHPLVKAHFTKNNLRGKVELSVWDFAGQHEYYNNHQHFLSTRSVFLVLWNVTEFNESVDVGAAEKGPSHMGDKPQQGKGIQGLEFWLWSLSMHLGKQRKIGDSDSREYFKILVIGTHFDQLGEVEQNKMGVRRAVVEKLCDKYELGLGLGSCHYLEVSCVNSLVNIPQLQYLVFVETIRMKYMGERIPLSYLGVESYVKELLARNCDYPVVGITLFYDRYPERIVRDALSLLHQWGRCVYFGNDQRLKNQVILDPQFLSKVTLAGFFRLDVKAQEKRKHGVIRHADLKIFWTESASPLPSLALSSSSTVLESSLPSQPLVERDDFWKIAELLMSFMEKFDVCFVLPEDKAKPFIEQRSLLPSLLPPRQNDREIRSEISILGNKVEAARIRVKELTQKVAFVKQQFDQKALSEIGISQFRALETDLIEETGKFGDLENRLKGFTGQLKAAQPWRRYWKEELGPGQEVQFERVFQFGNIPAELVSRMLARLHSLIEGDCVKRDFALLKNGEGTQAKVTVDVLLDQFVIEIRAGSLELGENMLKEIKESISEVLNLYSQLTVPLSDEGLGSFESAKQLLNKVKTLGADTVSFFRSMTLSGDDDGSQKSPEVVPAPPQAPSLFIEGVRSSFSNRIIRLEVIKRATGKDLMIGNEPGMSVLKLKELAGLVAPKTVEKKKITQGSAKWTEVATMFKLLGGDVAQIKQAFDIEDPEYRSMFEGSRKSLYQQQQNAPDIFRKQDHKYLPNSGLREEYLDFLQKKQQKFDSAFSTSLGKVEDQKTKAIAMIHGTNESVGWKIAQGGFGIVASVDDGFYGQGIYFTSKVSYAMTYTVFYERPVLVLSLVNPGNPFPVTEEPSKPGNLTGAKCKLGYQSHYCVTGQGTRPTDQVGDDSRDELVVFERAQALPKFMIYFK